MTQAEATFSISTHFHLINPYNSKTVDFSTVELSRNVQS